MELDSVACPLGNKPVCEAKVCKQFISRVIKDDIDAPRRLSGAFNQGRDLAPHGTGAVRQHVAFEALDLLEASGLSARQ